MRELSELTRSANRANATFYTIDPRGLVAGADIDQDVDPTEWNDYLRKSQDSLRVIAEQTGGFATVNQNDFDKALKRIDAESSDYYVLGYYSNNPDPLKRTRKIDVKVNRPNMDIWSRKAYRFVRRQSPRRPSSRQAIEIGARPSRGKRPSTAVVFFAGVSARLSRASLDCFLQVGLVHFDPDEVDAEPSAGYG